MTKLVFMARTENRFAGYKFPLRLRPLEDELLSSWLIRLAILHRTMPVTFTNLYLPHTKNMLWSSDMDLQADESFLAELSVKAAGIPVEVLHAMTLRSYEGYLYESVYKISGGTPFVLPLGLRARRATLPGLRFCPQCLHTDPAPYFRKAWRLSLVTVCPTHRCYFYDRCPHCNTPLMPYNACREGRMTDCYKCGRSLISDATDFSQVPSELVEVTDRLLKVLADGIVMISGSPVYSHLYFRVLHHMLRMFINRKWGAKLSGVIGFELVGGRTRMFESVALHDQAKLIEKAVWFLDEWPERFVDICRRKKVLSSVLLHDFEDAPFWYWDVVMRELYRPDRGMTEEEIRSAIAYMERRNIPTNQQRLSRLLGVNQVFRKRNLDIKRDKTTKMSIH